MNAVGFIDKQVIPVDDAWFVQTYWDLHTKEVALELGNKSLMGVRQDITREQALKPNTEVIGTL